MLPKSDDVRHRFLDYQNFTPHANFRLSGQAESNRRCTHPKGTDYHYPMARKVNMRPRKILLLY